MPTIFVTYTSVQIYISPSLVVTIFLKNRCISYIYSKKIHFYNKNIMFDVLYLYKIKS